MKKKFVMVLLSVAIMGAGMASAGWSVWAGRASNPESGGAPTLRR
jgi:hypothetical protein